MRRAVAAVLALAITVGACGAPPKPAPNPPVDPEGKRHVYLALGGRHVSGVEQDVGVPWPRLILRDVLPHASTLTVLASPWATGSSVLDQQVPDAERILADAGPGTVRTATLLVSGVDLLYGSSPASIAEVTTTIVQRLRKGGATVVLLLLPRNAVTGVSRVPIGSMDPQRDAALDRQLAGLLSEIASRNETVLVDLGPVSEVSQVIDFDGGLTTEANRKVADLVTPAVRAAISR